MKLPKQERKIMNFEDIKTKEQIVALKPSELLSLSLYDLEKIENTPGYIVNMDHWHLPSIVTGMCHVCLAGSVISRFVKKDEKWSWSNYEYTAFEKAMKALDYFRDGIVSYALIILNVNISLPDDLDRFIIEYEVNPKQFKSEIRDIINYLRKLGI